MALNSEQREAFEREGVVRVPGLVPEDRVAAAREVVLGRLEREGLYRDGRYVDEKFPDVAWPEDGSGVIRGIKKAAALRDLVTPEVVALAESLMDGEKSATLMEQPQLLFTFPNAGAWTVPHSIWHLDIPRTPFEGVPGVQMFTFICDVEPGGAGTLVASGSHHLLNGRFIRSKQVKRELKRLPWFRDLMSKRCQDRMQFVDEVRLVDGVEVRVRELHGKAGDAYLADMRLLHTLAPNAARRPRIMVTQRFLRESLKDSLLEAA